ncbi:hypothetical protein Vau01_048470 [Virgisporangium aurantiacum]|uniref:Methyltransferase domain-containing protein n=1 Tax=Virgisporangium aurantiacum TaxID=175570 RepID=A0A8J3Z4D7_9ACTN|nr:hypothetical protein Vau01_048470 [Virgisporangium aurantiacum]
MARNRWAVRLLDVGPADRVVEFGCGPGVAVAALAARTTRGLVVGVDHSPVMIRQAGRRNRAAIRAGRVRLVQAPVQHLTLDDVPFDAALAVNTVGMWPEPATRLRDLGPLLRPGGRIAVVSQPRCAGATAATSAAAAAELAALLTDAGFDNLRTEFLDLDPPAACVIGYLPTRRPGREEAAAGPEPRRAARPDGSDPQ